MVVVPWDIVQTSTRSGTEKTPPLPCVTVPLNLLETGGTRPAAFDFQLRPVGHNHDSDPVDHLLRFKDIVSNHVHRQGNSKFFFEACPCSKEPASSASRLLALLWEHYSSHFRLSQEKKLTRSAVFFLPRLIMSRGEFTRRCDTGNSRCGLFIRARGASQPILYS